jgi:hypothetical protein
MDEIHDIQKRLLRLFPVKSLKDSFATTSSKQDDILNEIIDSSNLDVLKTFVFNNFSFSRQHIYVYTHNIPYKEILKLQSNFFPYDCFRKTQTKDSVEFFYFYDLAYKVILTNPLEETELSFIWPFKIVIKENSLIFYFTILEKNINSYYPIERPVVDSERLVEEEQILNAIISYLNSMGSVQICDLNKGIKKLWDSDIIDSKYVKWKKSKSTTTEAMDESYTLKRQYPDVYENLLNSPLNKTVFKYIKDGEDFCDHFTIEPSEGKISIPIFPKQLNQISNVIEKIVEFNR